MVMIKKLPMKEYCNILARSVFALCPRGYGRSSFRIQESIQQGAIPVYISDEFVLPYNEEFPGLLVNIGSDILKAVYDHGCSDHTSKMRQRIERVKNNYTYEGCKQKILQEVNK
jgi:hypothetical protein